MMVNSLGRELPEKIGDYVVRPYQGAYTTPAREGAVVTKRRAGHRLPGDTKLLGSLEEAIRSSGLKDGMTISFHHSFREGDKIIGQVLSAIRSLGIKGLRFAPSAVVNIKNPSIVDFVRDGTIDRIEASGIRGELGDAVLAGEMEKPVILRTHGARPRAIEAGELQIDVAFIGASAADDSGNCTGQIGPNACGSLGYSFIDAQNAGCVIVITDNLVEYPCCPVGCITSSAFTHRLQGFQAVVLGNLFYFFKQLFVLLRGGHWRTVGENGKRGLSAGYKGCFRDRAHLLNGIGKPVLIQRADIHCDTALCRHHIGLRPSADHAAIIGLMFRLAESFDCQDLVGGLANGAGAVKICIGGMGALSGNINFQAHDPFAAHGQCIPFRRFAV